MIPQTLVTDYNGLIVCASQVFFPRTAAWDNLQKSLKAQFDAGVRGHLTGTESRWSLTATSAGFQLNPISRIFSMSIDTEKLQASLGQALCADIKLVPRNRHIAVTTPFSFADGDPYILHLEELAGGNLRSPTRATR